MNKILFSNRLKAERKKKFRSQEAFAEEYDRKYNWNENTKEKTILATLKNYENPNKDIIPSLEIVDRMCDILGCDVDYLLGRIDYKTHDKQFVQDYTGLSAGAIDVIIGLTNEAKYGNILKDASKDQKNLNEADKEKFVSDIINLPSTETAMLNALIESKYFPELLSVLNGCFTNWFFGSALDSLLYYLKDNAKPEYNMNVNRLIQLSQERANYESEESNIMAMQNVARKIALEFMEKGSSKKEGGNGI